MNQRALGSFPVMHQRWRFVLVLLAFIATMATVKDANAHPIHTTLTRVTTTRNVLTLNVRTFADDFSATVARFAGRAAPRDSSAPVADVLRYLQATFRVVDAAGKPVALESCGIRREKELYWLCLKATSAGGMRGVRIGNQMLTELHSDQVNIVQLAPPAARRTMLFTKSSALQELTQ